MRSLDPPQLLERIARILEQQVVPSLDRPNLKSDLLLIVGILDNLSTRVAEDAMLVEERVSVLRDLLERRPAYVIHPQVSAFDPSSAQDLRAMLVQTLREIDSTNVTEEIRLWLGTCSERLSDLNMIELGRMRPTRYGKSLELYDSYLDPEGDNGLA